MSKIILTAVAAAAFIALATPASAQYRFDWRVDPSNCHWTELCDYGGRPYLYRVRASYRGCRTVAIQRQLPDGRMVIQRVRRCGIRALG